MTNFWQPFDFQISSYFQPNRFSNMPCIYHIQFHQINFIKNPNLCLRLFEKIRSFGNITYIHRSGQATFWAQRIFQDHIWNQNEERKKKKSCRVQQILHATNLKTIIQKLFGKIKLHFVKAMISSDTQNVFNTYYSITLYVASQKNYQKPQKHLKSMNVLKFVSIIILNFDFNLEISLIFSRMRF